MSDIRQPQVLINTGRSKLWIIPDYGPDLYDQIKDIPLVEEPPNVMYGKPVRQRRDVGFYSDESEGYHYSRQMMPSTPLNTVPIFPELLQQLNQSLGTNFNGILVNRYKNGEKYLGAHSDDEKALDPGRKMVVSLAYGPGIRTFRIRDKKTNQIVLDLSHQPRTLLVMEGDFQQEFKHEIPIQKRVKEERISLTFRRHLQ